MKAKTKHGFHERLFQALNLWQMRHGRRLTQAALGELMGEVGGEVFAQNTVGGWFRDIVPAVEDMVFLAKALEVDPGWLAFGESSNAPRPTT